MPQRPVSSNDPFARRTPKPAVTPTAAAAAVLAAPVPDIPDYSSLGVGEAMEHALSLQRPLLAATARCDLLGITAMLPPRPATDADDVFETDTHHEVGSEPNEPTQQQQKEVEGEATQERPVPKEYTPHFFRSSGQAVKVPTARLAPSETRLTASDRLWCWRPVPLERSYWPLRP
jgi:hypothetical protein